jgi:hypothetical protein
VTTSSPVGGNSLSRRAWIVVGAGWLVIVALFVAMLVELDDSRTKIVSQEKIARSTSQKTGPILDSSAPLIQQIRGLHLPRTVAGINDATGDLTRGDALPQALAQVAYLLDEVSSRNLVGHGVKAARLIHALVALQRTLLQVQRASHRSQVRSFRTQVRSLKVQRRSLNIQMTTLEHVASLDRKTAVLGPPAP